MAEENKVILEVDGLSVEFRTMEGTVHAVNDLHYCLKEELLRLKGIPLEQVLDYPDPAIKVNQPLPARSLKKSN